jgi:hypothetical protein
MLGQLRTEYAALESRVAGLESKKMSLEQLAIDYSKLALRVDSLEKAASRFKRVGNEIFVDGYKFYTLIHSQAQFRVVSRNCIGITPKGGSGYDAYVAAVHWPAGKKDPPGNITGMRPAEPAYVKFTLADGSYVVYTGNCSLVSANAGLLLATGPKEILVFFTADLSEATNSAADAFAIAYPFIRDWTDRRVIGKDFAYRASGVPDNWHWSPSATQEAHEAGFHRHIQACVDNCLLANAQGLIVWDIEGQPYGHPISYIADPEFAHVHSPRMTQKLVKDLFKRITDSGLKAGLTIRPQQITPVTWNSFKYWQYDLNDADYFATLRRKIQYSYTELGVRIFYCDTMIRADQHSGVPPKTYTVIPPFEMWRDLCNEFPDCLLIPEQCASAWYGLSAPFAGNLGYVDPVVKRAYPKAFTFMHGQQAQYPRDTELLRKTMAEGNIGSFNAWFKSPEFNAIISIAGTAK